MTTFDEDLHEYTHAGAPVPSVTGVIDAEGLVDRAWYTDEARARGVAVHRATALDDLGAFDPAAWPDDVLARVAVYREWKRIARPRWTHVEASLTCASFGGTLDRAGQLPGWPRVSIVDIKCGDPLPWHGLQLAGYALLLGRGDAHRWTLHLGPDRWRLVPHRDPYDLARFFALVTKHAA